MLAARISSDQRSASSIAFFAPGVNGTPRRGGARLAPRSPRPPARLGVREAGVLQQPRRGRRRLAQQAEHEMLGPDRVVTELARLGLRVDDHLTRPRAEALERRRRVAAATARGRVAGRHRGDQRRLELEDRLGPDRAPVARGARPQARVQGVGDVAHVERRHACATLALCKHRSKR